MRRLAVAFAAVLLGAATPVPAHHSFPATYDGNKPVTLSGSVTKVEFRNPHIWVFIDVLQGGTTTNWACEGGAPTQLFRNGWRPDTLKPGDQITIEGFAAKDPKPVCNMRVAKLADGRRIFSGANDGAPGTAR